MKFIIITLLLVAGGSAVASTLSPYSGEDAYEIKSLSPDEINGLLQGKGMGLAKVAELNQYPGPRHVLDMADQLQLSNQQIAQTNQIFESMRKNAVSLGIQLVNCEKELDSLFSSGKIVAAELDSLLLKIGEIKAKLRGIHLHAHLLMKKILNQHQITKYDDLRGYTSGSAQHGHSH